MKQCLSLMAMPLAFAAAAVSVSVSVNSLAQQHRQIDAASGHAARSAPATIGGPKTARASGGPRFPLIPSGALNSTLPAAAAHRPVAKPNLAANAGHLNAVPHPPSATAAPLAPSTAAPLGNAAGTALRPAAPSASSRGAANPVTAAPAPALAPGE